MPRLNRPDNRLYIGEGGMGKSTLARVHLAQFPRVVIYDTSCEPENAAIVTRVCYRKTEFLEAIKPARFCVAWRGHQEIQPRTPKDAKNPRAFYRGLFEWVNRCVWARHDTLIVWDELDTFVSGDLPFYAHQLVHNGRHRGCRAWGMTRAPFLVPRDLTRNVQRFCVFHVSEPRDLQWLADKIGTEAAAAVPGLKAYHAVDWTAESFAAKKSPFA